MIQNRIMKRAQKILYGGDYNPEQWTEDVWEEDMRLLKLAGVDCVTLNVFNWASLQPDETTYCFDRLDRIMNLVRKNGLMVILATSTAAHPAWMAKKYPEVLRTEFNGMHRKFGGRHNSCPNSLVYQKYSAALSGKLAERYGKWDNLAAWHINNEYGGECYCENCEKAFRVWLKEKYQTLETLNRVWNTAFWGHTFYDWDEIVVPNLLSEHFTFDRTTFQGISLDYRRFNSDSMLKNFQAEKEAIRKYCTDVPVTTNLMGFYKSLDYQKWARNMDFVSWDNYPSNDTSSAVIAMNHDLMRGIRGGQPFALMEQTPSVTNWLSYNALKRPGVMRLWSYQAIAHGADTVMFFQMRRSVGACEKYHGAVIDHVGTEHTRVFREVASMGAELQMLGDRTLGSRVPAKAAIMIDWDNWWAIEYSAGPSCDLRYLDELECYYTAFYRQNIPVDLISVEDDLKQYNVVITPLLYMVKTGYDEKLRDYVRQGGSLVVSFFSGIVDEHDLVVTGGYPGKLRDILGIWVEEQDALPSDAKNGFIWNETHYPATLLCDLLHTEGAEKLAEYQSDFYAGMPVLTRNVFGEGIAYYVATRSSHEFYHDFIKMVCGNAGVKPVFEEMDGLEVCVRETDSERYLFFLNHNPETISLQLPVEGLALLEGRSYACGEEMVLPAKGVSVYEIKK